MAIARPLPDFTRPGPTRPGGGALFGSLRGLWPTAGAALAVLLAVVVAAPLVGLLSFIAADDASLIRRLARTVLGEYAANSAALSAGVALSSLVLGTSAAWLITTFRFPGQRFFNWALVLPLAMPAYVLAYAYTDLLQVTGPVQATLRDATGWGVHDYWFPNIRSLGGAVFVLSAVLYPYVYVLARSAFLEQSICAVEVGRTLGCTTLGAMLRVSLPMARPAIAAGVAFVVMETLADFGTVAYFEVRTLTTGIYRAWYALGSPAASAQLACLLLLLVALTLIAERRSRGRGRYANTTSHIYKKEPVPLHGWRAVAATSLCALPLLAGFVIPVASLLHLATEAGAANGWTRLAVLMANTAVLAAVAAAVIVGVAVVALLATARGSSRLTRTLIRGAALGYAAPGAVIGVGILVVTGAFDSAMTRIGAGFLIGGSLLALVHGYLVRFFAVAYSPLEAGLSKITASLEDAARILGCNRVGVLGRLRLPLLRSSLLAAALLVSVDVAKELPATYVLRPFNFDTLAVEAFQLATTERLDAAALPSLLICLLGLLPVIILCRMIDRGRPGAARG